MSDRTLTLCDSCTPAVVNNDWTHLDFHFNGVERDDDDMSEADHEHARIMATLEVLGWLTPVGDADMPGYFGCAVCDGIQCGGGHTFTSDR